MKARLTFKALFALAAGSFGHRRNILPLYFPSAGLAPACQQAEQMLAVAVYAASGKVVIHQDHLHDAPHLALEKIERPDNRTMELRARKAPKASNPTDIAVSRNSD